MVTPFKWTSIPPIPLRDIAHASSRKLGYGGWIVPEHDLYYPVLDMEHSGFVSKYLKDINHRHIMSTHQLYDYAHNKGWIRLETDSFPTQLNVSGTRESLKKIWTHLGALAARAEEIHIDLDKDGSQSFNPSNDKIQLSGMNRFIQTGQMGPLKAFSKF